MNSLANLNAVMDDQGEASTWPSDDHGWDPPVATICTAASLSADHSRLHLHPSAGARQEWDWSDSQLFLASQYNTAEEQDIDCKHSMMHADALAGGGAGRLRQYNGILTATSVTPPLASMATQSSWPELLNAVPIRHTLGLDQSSSGSCYSSSFFGGEVGLGGGGAGGSALNSYYVQPGNLLGGVSDLEQRRLHDILKRGMYPTSAVGNTQDLISARIGLNLGGRTYFSAEDNTTLARFHATKRFRPHSPASMHVPLCQAEGCKADLSIAKHYHRRHKVCEYHSKAATVIINGNTQRFCQQCSRFHALGEFDEGKRSCRKRLADHNRRRRKPQPPPPPAAVTSSADVPTTCSTGNLPLIPTEQDHDTAKTTTTQNAGIDPVQQANGQPMMEKETGVPANQPVSSADHTPSLISTMSHTPSILQLTLQNSNGDNSHSSLAGSDDGDKGKDSTPYHASQVSFLLNGGGPSLSLSSNVAGAGTGTHIAGAGEAGKATSQQHINSSNPTRMSFSEVELSVPWLRGHQMGSSASVIQESLMGRSPTSQHDEDAEAGSIIYGSSARLRQANNTGQYLNEHGRLLAEHMQSLHSQAASRSATTSALRDHHGNIKADNSWIMDNAVTNDEEGQTVLSLLETASNKDHHHHHHHNPSLSYNHHHHNSLHVAHQHHHREHSLQDNARHPLGFLQAHQTAMHSTTSADINQEASEAALSLQCMQVLRPLNESLYPTADFMKDDFV